MSVKIVVDSTADVPQELIEKYQMEVFPLAVNFGDESYLDGVDITPEQFFEKLEKAEKPPTTSQVPTGVFLERFEQFLEGDDQYICLFLGSHYSGTVSAAQRAVEQLQTDKIKVIDSCAVTFPVGHVALVLADRAQQGYDFERLIDLAYRLLAHNRNRFIVDTLEYLKRGGRLSSTSAFVGTLLNIKPILTMRDGKLVGVEKARGRKKAIAAVCNWLEKNSYDLNNKYVAIFHATDKAYADQLKEKVLARYPQAVIVESAVGCVVGTHSGPSCIALNFIDIDKDDI